MTAPRHDGDASPDLRRAIGRAGQIARGRSGDAYVRPGESTTGATPLEVPERTGVTPGCVDVRVEAERDRAALHETLANARTSPTAAAVLERFHELGGRLAVLDPGHFDQLGGGDAIGARYDPERDAVLVRSDWLAGKPAVTASAIVAAAVRAVDEATGLAPGARAHRARALARVAERNPDALRQVEETLRQTTWELHVALAARALLVQGQVVRELGVSDRASGPLAVAAAGANDRTTYEQVFAIVAAPESPFNPEGRRSTGAVAL